MNPTRLIVFIGAVAFFSCVSFTLLHNNYLSDLVLHQISDHIIQSGKDPHATRLMGTIFYNIPSLLYTITAPVLGMAHPIIPSLTAIVASAGLVWLAAGQQGASRLWTALFAATIALNPIVLWVATATGGYALSVLVYACMCIALTRIAEHQDPGDYLKLGLASALFIFISPTSIVLCVAMIPWILMLTPRTQSPQTLLAYYLVVFTPIAMASLSVSYLNWSKIGHFSPFIAPLNIVDTQDFFWNAPLNAHNFSARLESVPLFMIAAVAFFPVLVLAQPFDSTAQKRAFAAALLSVLTTPLVAALSGIPYHMLDYLPYLAGPLAMIARQTVPSRRRATLYMQAASVMFAWMLLSIPGAALPNGWLQAVTGTKIAGYADEKAIAQWIAQHQQTISVDPVTDYRIIALANQPDKMVLPANNKHLTTDLASLSQALLTRPPGTRLGEIDHLNALEPTLWQSGLSGFELAFEHGPYKIWTQAHLP